MLSLPARQSASGDGLRARLRARPGLAEKARFLVVGAYNTAFGYVLFAATFHVLGHVVHYTAILVGTYLVSILNAFFAYRWIVFRVRGRWMVDLARFSSVYVVSLAMNLVLLPLLVEVVGLGVLVAQAVAVLFTAVVSYVAHKRFSFKRAAP